MIRVTLEPLTLQDAGLDVPDKPPGDFFLTFRLESNDEEKKKFLTGEKELAPLTPSELCGRLDVVEVVQVDDINHRAHHARVIL